MKVDKGDQHKRYRDVIRMRNKYEEICLTLVIRKMKIMKIMGCHYTSISMAKIIRIDYTKCCKRICFNKNSAGKNIK